MCLYTVITFTLSFICDNDMYVAAYGVYDVSSYYITRVLSSIFIDVAICDKFESRQAGGVSVAVLSCLNRDIKFRTMSSPDDAITVT